MKEYTHITHTFRPIYNEKSKILILGTLPSVKSRESAFYYGHKQNRFWKLIAEILQVKTPETTAEKTAMLLSHHIAIWDVVAECDIIGSSDSSIKNVVPTDICKILPQTAITKIYANGNTAKKLYDKYQKPLCGIEINLLPSTSPANAAWSFERLKSEWAVIKKDL